MRRAYRNSAPYGHYGTYVVERLPECPTGWLRVHPPCGEPCSRSKVAECCLGGIRCGWPRDEAPARLAALTVAQREQAHARWQVLRGTVRGGLPAGTCRGASTGIPERTLRLWLAVRLARSRPWCRRMSGRCRGRRIRTG